MFSGDRNLLDAHSAVSERMRLYVSEEDSMTIIVAGAGTRESVSLASNISVILPGGENKATSFSNMVQEGEKVLKEGAVDCITAQDPFFIGLAALRARGKRKIPLQIQLHTDPFSRAYLFEKPRRLVEYVLMRHILKRASCVRVVSKRLKENVSKLTHAPVSTLPILVEAPPQDTYPRPDVFPEGKVILTVSRLAPEKRLHLVIDALAKVPDATLVIAGEGPEKERLEARARNRGVFERVRFIGWQDELAPLYAHADVFVQMSAYEGFGMALLEAALSECPIVATNAGIAGGELKDGIHFTATSPSALSLRAALSNHLQKPEEGKRRAREARDVALALTSTQDEYIAAYKKTLLLCRA